MTDCFLIILRQPGTRQQRRIPAFDLVNIYVFLPAHPADAADSEAAQAVININGLHHAVVNFRQGKIARIVGNIRGCNIAFHEPRCFLHILQPGHPGRHRILRR